MPALPDELFGPLEKATLEARETAEQAAEAAVNTLAVNRAEPYASLNQDQRRLRNALRARARQLGEGSLQRGLPHLVEEIAYQQWHQMLFARFLAENELLMHSSGVPVTLQECVELAAEEGEPDAWSLATRYASTMLPGIFSRDDPAVQVRLAPEGRLALERTLNGLPGPVFTSDDGLGWMYQFWQSKKKAEVNASERKIGGADIAPVTQLFTEDYMVRFLLENSLGAWWAARHPDSPLVETFAYLRYREDGTPAAGTFPGWPDRAAEITMMDPCCGSGHFVVGGFLMLYRMRMEEDGLDAAAAGDAVLRDNLFGLEIDPRCTQIAAFALALTAWKTGGYRELPMPNVACSGIPVQGQLETWTSLAGDDDQLRTALERLYYIFQNAPDLGSLIDPAHVPQCERMFVRGYEQVEPLLGKALAKERSTEDPVGQVFGVAAESAARVIGFLARHYILIATNVPYLAGSKQSEVLRNFCKERYPDAKNDLATVFFARCRGFSSPGASYAVVTPHNWRFLKGYSKMRKSLLSEQTWHLFVNLGPKSFRTPMWDFNVGLSVLTNQPASPETIMMGIDASVPKTVQGKATLLREAVLQSVKQWSQLENSHAAISITELGGGPLLSDYVSVHYGSKPGQTSRVTRFFWELPYVDQRMWVLMESTPSGTATYSGKSKVCLSLPSIEQLEITGFGIRGREAWGQRGIILSQMANLPCSIYLGGFFDNNTSVILPDNSAHLSAIYAFMKSGDFVHQVRIRNQKIDVDTGSMINVPFDLKHWQATAEACGVLAAPHSDDPLQWLFEGDPVGSTDPLQVATARLLGYHWPQKKQDDLDAHAMDDGILCLSSVAGALPGSEHLRRLLAAAYGEGWSVARQEELLAAVGFSGKNLEDWLRDSFFAQHCKTFQNRPFIWHIWDGHQDGFGALVNYHKLDAAHLDKLIHTYLGTWIQTQRRRRDADEPGAEGLLVAALALHGKLVAIREGEPPYDIYVRWKPLHEQPLGWAPDLNDGVRLNIRPFVTASVLRSRFTIDWRKDRGKNPDGSERLNDLHYTRAEKLAARAQASAATGTPE